MATIQGRLILEGGIYFIQWCGYYLSGVHFVYTVIGVGESSNTCTSTRTVRVCSYVSVCMLVCICVYVFLCIVGKDMLDLWSFPNLFDSLYTSPLGIVV